MDGGLAHTRQYAVSPAVTIKNQYKAIVGILRMTQILVQSALCIDFVEGDGRGMLALRAAGNMLSPPRSLSKTNAK
eukprot:6233169-Pyramimonas_sp.AAC.1